MLIGLHCPVWVRVEIKHRNSVGVDGEHQDREADDVHHHPGLHHVHGLHGAVAEHDGVGGRGHRQGEGVRAGDCGGDCEEDGVEAHVDGHVRQDGHQGVGRGRVVAQVGDHHRQPREDDAG